MANESVLAVGGTTSGRGFKNFLLKNKMAIVAVLVILMLVFPLPKFIIDLLMVAYLAMSIIVLLTVIRIPRASSFSSFPQITLFITLFGIGLNVSSTRLILSAKTTNGLRGLAQTQSAMVQAFAKIVAGDNLVIGFIIFIILIVVQVIVITKGAGRVSEVSARFTLDAMSTKNFDIDNQLNQGYITEDEAKMMKEELRRDIDFYSNMDGSSKFVSGSVKAGIVITIVNLLGGFAVGMIMNHLSFNDALEIYAKLTIGDGLLSQLPALMISFATGILVTADKSSETLDEQVINNFSVDGTIYQIVGVVLAIMAAIFHNQTVFVLVPLGALLVFYGFSLTKKKKAEEIKVTQKAAEQKEADEKKSKGGVENNSVAPLDALSFELGYALLPLVTDEHGAELVKRIQNIRSEAALDIGLPVPSIRIIDNMNLDPSEYCFKIRGIEACRGSVKLGHYMCMNTGGVIEELKGGEPTKDPTFGLSAIWVPEDRRVEAEQAGYLVADPPTLISTHLTETIRHHAWEILGREETAILIKSTKENNPIVVQEVMEGDGKMTYGEIEKVLRELLREQVSIRNMVPILETLSNFKSITRNTWDLVAKVRETLGLQICLQYADDDKKLRVINISLDWQEKIREYGQFPADGSKPFVAFDPVDGRAWIKAVSDEIAAVTQTGFQPILFCTSPVRMLVKSSIEMEMPGVPVISDKEVIAATQNVSVEIIGEVK